MEDEALEAMVEEYDREDVKKQNPKPEMPSPNLFRKPETLRTIFDDVDQ